MPPVRSRVIVLLLGAGALAIIVGEGWYLTAKAAVAHAAQSAMVVRTLPVHTYTQYTQRGPGFDTSGLWTGLAIAGVGIAVLLAAAVVAVTRSRAA